MGLAPAKQWKGNVNGKTATAELTGYTPHPSENGYGPVGPNGRSLDARGKELNPEYCVCAAPSDVKFGTLVKFSGTGTDIDGKIYRVVDRGGAIVHGHCAECGGDRYRFDLLFPDKKTANTFGHRHKCTVQFGDIVNDDGETTSTGSSNDSNSTTTSGGGSTYLKTTRSWKTNPKTDWLLEPSDDERKYGINIYDGEQPLIKFSTYKAISEHGDYVGALKTYCEFLYYLLNSEVTTAQVTCIGMPWIRPGFNVWYDPIYSDAIYYCTNVQQQGTPTTGAMTSLTLVLGRNRKGYIENADRFGSFKDRSDNVFISDMKEEYRVTKFGECLTSAEAFENIKNASVNYYNEEQFETMDAKDSEFHKNIYVNGGDKSPVPENINKDKVFSGTYTEDEINKQLASMYGAAPKTVTDRISSVHSAVEKAKEYFDNYHILEKHTFG